MVRHGPYPHPSRTPVADRAQVQPAPRGGQIGDVRPPNDVEGAAVETTAHEVRDRVRRSVADGGEGVPRRQADTGDALVPHDLRDRLPGDPVTAVTEICLYPRCSV